MTNTDAIPEELKELCRWVCADDDSKVPMTAWTNDAASSTDPDTWAYFQEAEQAQADGLYDWCGFVFADDGYIGIDIDDGYDEDGFISPLAADIIERCQSYTEQSRSGRGFHVIVKGNLPFKGRNNLRGVEIYRTARYFIMTGNVVLYPHIRENQAAVDYVVDKYFPEMRDGRNDARMPRVYNPVWLPPEGHRFRLRPEYPEIPSGSRNLCLASLAGTLHTLGYAKKQIYEELMYVNRTACSEPLDKREIQTICSSITRYKR